MCYALSMEKTVLAATDIHYISSAVHHFNDAFVSKMENEDGKMTILSEEIMESLVCYVIEQKPDALVITGDLSWNGDIISHLEIRDYLMNINDAGIEVYVIPGNHDIGKERKQFYKSFCSVLPDCADQQDFNDIYAPFLIHGDSSSLSYSKEFDDLRMLFIDVNGTDNPGNVNDNTLLWIDRKLSESTIPCIAFSHQNFLVQHPMFAQRRIINGDDLINIFTKHHVHIGFSGHSHLQRIAENENFIDICTACLSAYEHHIGVIHIQDDVIQYHTESLPVRIPSKKQKKLGITCSEDERKYFLSSIKRIMHLNDNPILDKCIVSFFDGHILSHTEQLQDIEDKTLSDFINSFQLNKKDMNQINIRL